MDFVQELQRFWQRQGFRRVEYDSRIVWLKEDKEEAALVDIIPEWLPGQPKIPVNQLESEIKQLEKKLTLHLGKRVDRLTLMLCRELPDEEQLKETMNYPNVWWVDWKNARILIYEKQRADFLGQKSSLEDFVVSWQKQQKWENHIQWRRMLQPVTISIMALNVLIFLALSVIGDTEDPVFMAGHGAMSWESVMQRGQYYRLLTAMFLHFGADHLLQNMLILMLTGCRMERAVGRIRYLLIYLGAGLAASVTSVLFTLQGHEGIAAGASGAIFGIMGGLVCLLLKDTISRRRRYFQEIGLSGVIFMIVCASSYGFFNSGVDNAAHIGGLVGGFILTGLLTAFL